MHQLTRLVALVIGVLSIAGAGATSAGAFTNSGDTTYTGTSGPVTLTYPGGITVTCASDAFTGSTTTGAVDASSMTLSGCRITGISLQVTCAEGFTPDSYDVGSGVVTGTMSTACSMRMGGREVCTLSGAPPATYRNATATARGAFTVPANSVLVARNGSGGTCPLGNGVTGSSTAVTETITGAAGGAWSTHNGPAITP